MMCSSAGSEQILKAKEADLVARGFVRVHATIPEPMQFCHFVKAGVEADSASFYLLWNEPSDAHGVETEATK
jgi:hypothetical protein